MRLGGRIQAAIEVLADIEKRKRPVSEALRSWGQDHRFAGSGDRAIIGNLVYDSLRKKASTQFLMQSDSARKLVFGTLLRDWDYSPEQLKAELADDKFAPDLLTDEEFARFSPDALSEAAPHIQADVPEWLLPSLQSNFADEWLDEAQAFTARPPVDMRANTLKTTREKLLKSLQKSGAQNCAIARNGLRIPAKGGTYRQPNVQAEAVFQQNPRLAVEAVNVEAASPVLAPVRLPVSL